MDVDYSTIVAHHPKAIGDTSSEAYVVTLGPQERSTAEAASSMPTTDADPSSHYRVSLDNQSGFQSHFTDSTGRQSQLGATWKDALILTMNSGFGPGTPRSDNYKGVREGREHGGFLPRLKGVGRTGKGPAPVPEGMLRALGVEKDSEEPQEGREGFADAHLESLIAARRDVLGSGLASAELIKVVRKAEDAAATEYMLKQRNEQLNKQLAKHAKNYRKRFNVGKEIATKEMAGSDATGENQTDEEPSITASWEAQKMDNMERGMALANEKEAQEATSSEQDHSTPKRSAQYLSTLKQCMEQDGYENLEEYAAALKARLWAVKQLQDSAVLSTVERADKYA